MSDVNIERALGRMEETLKQVLENQTRADTGRKQLYESVEALRAEIADYKRRIEGLERRIDAVERPVAELSKWRERSIGSIITISGMAALIGGGLATSWHKIIDIFK